MPDNPDLRIPLLSVGEAQGDALKALSSPNGHMGIFGLLAQAGTNVLPVMRMARAILSQQQLDGALRELAILVALRLEGGRYEWPQHVEIAKLEGLSDEDIAAVERLDLAFPQDEVKRAIAQYARQLVEDVRVSDEAFAAAARHLEPRELVELMIAVGFYMMLVRVTETAGLVTDEVEGASVLQASRR